MARRRKIRVVPIVTREYAEKFVAQWLEETQRGGDAYEALGRTDIMEWPEDDEDAQADFIEIADEITNRTLSDPGVKAAIANAFVREATAVFKREKRAPRVAVVRNDANDDG